MKDFLFTSLCFLSCGRSSVSHRCVFVLTMMSLPHTHALTQCFWLFQAVLAKSCMKLLCEDPVFSEYIKVILMDERTFLNNNTAYSFLTCFLHKVGGQSRRTPGSILPDPCLWFLNAMFWETQVQVLSASSCSNLIDVLVTNLLNEQSSLQPELTAAQWAEFSKSSGQLNAVRTHTHTHTHAHAHWSLKPLLSSLHQDLRVLVLLLSIHPPQSIDPALSTALQELLGRCRLCLQQRNALELEAKDQKSKGNTHTYTLRSDI